MLRHLNIFHHRLFLLQKSISWHMREVFLKSFWQDLFQRAFWKSPEFFFLSGIHLQNFSPHLIFFCNLRFHFCTFLLFLGPIWFYPVRRVHCFGCHIKSNTCCILERKLHALNGLLTLTKRHVSFWGRSHFGVNRVPKVRGFWDPSPFGRAFRGSVGFSL